MFEGNLQIPDTGTAGTEGELRAIAWPELVARLAANRDLRRVLLTRDDSASASFNPCAAALLSRGEDYKHAVNLDVSVDGKYPTAQQTGAGCGATTQMARPGDREK